MDAHLIPTAPDVGPYLQADAERRFPGGAAIKAQFEIPRPGFSVTVLFGPSGSGKTTALRLLAGLERADRGAIQVDGSYLVERRAPHPPAHPRPGIWASCPRPTTCSRTSAWRRT